MTVKGLPSEVKFCKKCLLSNQKPTSTNELLHNKDTTQIPIEFDPEGVCYACRSVEKKFNDTIDWKLREKELIELSKKYKDFKGPYNCIVPGSGGKDSAYQSHILKYKYNFRPLTVTWTPHIYTNIGFKNFQSWLNHGGFDNYLFTPNGKIHRLVTRNALINLLHPFQPFIVGQKFFPLKMASLFNIDLIFYGEQPSDYGAKLKNIKSFGLNNPEHPGYSLDAYKGKQIEDLFLGGKKIEEYLREGIKLSDLMVYLPPEKEELQKKNVDMQYLGYYLNFIPQENFYYASKHTNFQVNDERIEGTYQKYASIDDKTDGFFYYTYYIKYGIGRAMLDASQEIRHGHINIEEGKSLIKQFDGEYPKRYLDDFLEYVKLNKNEFDDLCDSFRNENVWRQVSNRWELKKTPW